MNVQANQRDYHCRNRPLVRVPGAAGASQVVVAKDFERGIALASMRDMDYPMPQEVAVGEVRRYPAD